MSFTHLHVHTAYSLLDGSGRINEMIARTKELGMDSIAITDHGAMYGVIEFYKEAKKQGIKPVLGCEVYVVPGSRFDKEKNEREERYYHLILLAENNEGYQNLMKIVSIGYTEGFYYKPRVDFDVLRTYSKGIIACSACLAGEIARYLSRNMYEEAKKSALRYADIFGKDNFFLELQDHGIYDQKTVNAGLLRLSEDTGIPLIATNDVHYTFAEDAEPHDILLCIQTGKKVSDPDRMRYEGGQYYLKSEEEMEKLFPYAKEALENTHRIAERCNVEIEFGVTKLPRFHVPEGKSSDEYLRELCRSGLKKRYPNDDGRLLQRLEYELSVIEKMGYVDYFLIVSDFIRYARSNKIMVGPGRGSAAGSIVAYCLEITNIDPIKYDLLFERFLNPERVSMPDIDVDFCYERRQEVIDYVIRTYGKDNVAQIVTFGTLAARGVIRDVGRVLDIPYAKCDKIAKLVPQELNMTLTKALSVSPELKSAYNEEPDIKKLIDMSLRLEGLPRHTSMHAAGVLIAGDSVDKFVPLSRNQDGTIVTQFTMTVLEELGLLKMDFLGLRTLTVIRDAVNMVESSTGEHIDTDAISLDDKGVYDMLGAGKTEGVFQLESRGMTAFMKELKPESIGDIIAGVALYRPGPMDFIPRYIEGKNNRDSVSYECPQLEPILKETYGCIVYQEQVMQIVQSLAGYTLGRADLVRRAMSKKKADVMLRERQNFVYGNEAEGVKGCIKNGISEEVANRIFDEMVDFASYAFNKSHAAAYAVVSYQTAWLKYYYKREYMAALMTSVIDNIAKTAEYIDICRHMGISIAPPDINEGDYGFTPSRDDKNSIRYGLSAIKGVGRTVVESIVRERNRGGRFKDMEDFMVRMGGAVNKKAMEYFIKSGAFDSFEGNRRQKMFLLPQLVDKIQSGKKDEIEGQISLFDIAGEESKSEYRLKLPDVEEYPKEELLNYEKEAIGIYLSGHPLDVYADSWKKHVTVTSADFFQDEDTGECSLKEGMRVVAGGIVNACKYKTTKNEKQMAFMTVEDLYGQVEVIVFPNLLERVRDYTDLDQKIYIAGHVTIDRDDTAKLIADNIIPFEKIKKDIWIAFADKDEYDRIKDELSDMCYENSGSSDVIIYLRKERAKKILSEDLRVSLKKEFTDALCAKFGDNNVKIVEKSIEKRPE